MHAILHPPPSSSNTLEDNNVPIVVPLPYTLPYYQQKTPAPHPPLLVLLHGPPILPAWPSSLSLLLLLSSLSLSLAGDDVAVGMWVVTWQHGCGWWCSRGVDLGSDVAFIGGGLQRCCWVVVGDGGVG